MRGAKWGVWEALFMYISVDSFAETFLSSIVVLLAIGLVVYAGKSAAQQSPPESNKAPLGEEMHISPAMQQGWERYRSGIEDVRRLLYGSPFARNAGNQLRIDNLLYQLQAAAYMTVIAPRPDYPTLIDLYYAPPVFTWLGANPDFVYSFAFLDGKHTYRLRGNRSNSCMLIIQSNSAFYSELNSVRLLDSFNVDTPVGHSFEYTISATKPTGGNWIRIDANSSNNWLLVREAFCNWNKENPGKMDIEITDNLPIEPYLLDEAEFIRRMDRAVSLMKYLATDLGPSFTATALRIAGPNRFYTVSGGGRSQSKDAGEMKPDAAASGAGHFSEKFATSPDAVYSFLAYDISPDEALIIELNRPESKYWSIQLNDQFNQVLDYVDHQSSLNADQVKVEPDGRVRIVLSALDPGVPNWLDCVGTLQGLGLMRWYFPSRATETPVVTKVKLSDVRKYLPSDIPLVSAAERARELKGRKAAVLRRYYR
jgi:hypothetical protein